jgi:hypothetical protein
MSSGREWRRSDATAKGAAPTVQGGHTSWRVRAHAKVEKGAAFFLTQPAPAPTG